MAKQVPEEIKEKLKAAESAIDQIKTRFGDGAIMRFGESKTMQVDAVSTGCLSVDIALGVGGVPRARKT
jgi:recombination protein RecA